MYFDTKHINVQVILKISQQYGPEESIQTMRTRLTKQTSQNIFQTILRERRKTKNKPMTLKRT